VGPFRQRSASCGGGGGGQQRRLVVGPARAPAAHHAPCHGARVPVVVDIAGTGIGVGVGASRSLIISVALSRGN
jgi:hypothetical protein